MGLLKDGKWSDQWYTPDEQGRFVRSEAQFRKQITADGSSGFAAEAGRYHLYISHACPWCHRVSIIRQLKGLTDVIGMSVVDPYMGKQGWWFSDNAGCIPDTVNHVEFMHQIYTLANPHYSGRVTVPVLWDTKTKTIVSNESRDIIRMLGTQFDAFAKSEVDFCPEDLREEIDRTLDSIYPNVNNGVYRAGFATTQAAYEEGVTDLFAALDRWDEVLGTRRYLCGERITEADWCLFVTLLRFDVVYVGHFKCNIRRIQDYPNLWHYVLDLYQQPGVAETWYQQHTKEHYYRSHPEINPTGIVPRGPAIDFTAPHDRAGKFTNR